MADVVFVETTTGSAMFTKRKNDPDFRQGPAGFVIVNLSVLSHNPTMTLTPIAQTRTGRAVLCGCGG